MLMANGRVETRENIVQKNTARLHFHPFDVENTK